MSQLAVTSKVASQVVVRGSNNRVSSPLAGSTALIRAPFRSEQETHASARFSKVVGPSFFVGDGAAEVALGQSPKPCTVLWDTLHLPKPSSRDLRMRAARL